MGAGSNAPVIIKRKKVVADGGHHGGAWKVAYADFVTAMMAFFMLMWLLNATTESQRKGLADYFSPTIPVNRISGGGDGMFGGENIFSERIRPQSGAGGTTRNASQERQARGQNGVDISERRKDSNEGKAQLRKVEDMLRAHGGESMVSDHTMRHIVTRVTDKGLIVELFDLPGRQLFEPGTDRPSPLLKDLIGMLVEVFSLVKNDLAIGGHTRAHVRALRKDPSWRLSTDRAEMARQLIEAAGIEAGRIVRITGHADRNPVARDPLAVRNNRVELILLRRNP